MFPSRISSLRLIGTIRRVCLEQLLFWMAADLDAEVFSLQNLPQVELMHIAGWSSTRMAATYVHPSKRRLTRAIERLDQAVAAD